MLASELLGLVLIDLMLAAMVAGLLSGGGRFLAWKWVHGAVKALLVCAVVCFLLAFWSLAVTATLSTALGGR